MCEDKMNGNPMGTNCVTLKADLLIGFGRDFIASLSDDKEVEIIQAFSRYFKNL